MSVTVATLTTYKCDACGKSESIGGDYPTGSVKLVEWEINVRVLTKLVDLCPECASELKSMIKISISDQDEPHCRCEALGHARHAMNCPEYPDELTNGPVIGSYHELDVHGIGVDVTEGGSR